MSPIATRRFWLFSGGVAAILIVLAILVAANFILGSLRLRLDLTEDKIYTLSPGTRNVLAKLDAPVTLKLFFNGSSPDVPIPLKSFVREVTDLLKEYQLAAKGQLVVENYDPQPDSDAEEWAERYGLSGQNLGLVGAGESTLYLGLVAVKGDAYTAIPFLDPRNEELLEYNITRLVARVANPRKPVVGLMTSLPVLGFQSFPYALPGQPPPRNQPPWIAFRNLGEDYDLRRVALDAGQIEPEIQTLVLVHPKQLSEPTQFAIDQFVLRGGRLLAFIDPLCLADAAQGQSSMMMGMSPPKPSSDLGKLGEAWGLGYDPNKVVADLEASTKVRQGENDVEDNPVFLTLQGDVNINGKDVITANLESMVLPCAGAFTGSGTPLAGIGSLLVSSTQSELIAPMLVQLGPDSIRREFKPGLKRLNLAVRLQGRFKTAFPEGKPKPAPKPEGEEEEQKPEKEKTAAVILKESAATSTVIIVADVDLLYDQFAAQELPFFGQRVFQPINDNINFFLNTLEQLAGSADLAAIRSRGRLERPFDRVQALERAAQQRWFLEEQALQAKLDSTRQRLEELQSKKDKSQRYILSPEQEQEIKNFKQEILDTQVKLKEVRKNLRKDIERLGLIVKALNIVAAPALLFLAGGLFWLYRRRARD